MRVGLEALLAALLALALTASGAAAQTGTIPADVLGPNGDQHIDYPPWDSDMYAAPGFAVGAVGDVNGDGLEDIAGGFAHGRNDRSRVYITFSDRLGGIRDAIGAGGFEVQTDWFWYGLASAGDVNGDGLGDVAIMRTDRVTVVFGKTDSTPVDASDLGPRGFTITGVGAGVSSGSGGIYFNTGIVALNDLNLDGVRDLLVQSGPDAAIVYPPRAAAGTTIDASTPGPHVTRLTATGAMRLDDAYVDTLGDVNGDGRDDVMVAGEEREGTDQIAYGVLSPLPGTLVDLATVAGTAQGFEVRSHDGEPGWYGELESALTLGDQNGDGKREVGMVGFKHGTGGRRMRVVFTPAPGAKLDVDDLGATDERGYRLGVYSGEVIDVGDQNGDGRGDFANSRYVYFTDPSKETGDREMVHSGFYFALPGPASAAVAAAIDDLNDDDRPELAVARVHSRDNCESPDWCGETATFAVDVFDSAASPSIPLPEPPVELPSGELELPVDLGTGAGSRGGASLGVRPQLEVAPAAGEPSVVTKGGLVSTDGQTMRLALRVPGGKLERGKAYRARYVAANGRGQSAEGPWRSFVYGQTAGPAGPPPGSGPGGSGPGGTQALRKPRLGSLFARRGSRALAIGFRRLAAARGKARICFTRKAQRRCFTKLKPRTRGKYTVHSARIGPLPRGAWKMTATFTGSGDWGSQTAVKHVRMR